MYLLFELVIIICIISCQQMEKVYYAGNLFDICNLYESLIGVLNSKLFSHKTFVRFNLFQVNCNINLLFHFFFFQIMISADQADISFSDLDYLILTKHSCHIYMKYEPYNCGRLQVVLNWCFYGRNKV
ncbi:hypothetical protein ACOSQ3_001208 [Xanthoceras sorbifolium]